MNSVFNANTKSLVAKYRVQGLLIDTNLFLLLVIGHYYIRRIETVKRTARYTKSDYSRLRAFTSQFQQFWTTPNIVTEVDNLSRQLPQNEWPAYSLAIREKIIGMSELVCHSEEASAIREFSRLGLTDCVMLRLADGKLLLSDDLPLYFSALKAGRDAINFNHLRIS